MRAYRQAIKAAPDAVGGALALIKAPPAPFVPPEMVGTPVLAIIAVHTGDLATAETELAPIRGIGTPLVDIVGPMPYTAVQQLLDETYPWRSRAYFKAAFMDELTDGAINDLIQLAPENPSPMTALLLQPLGGAYARVADEATALGHRDAGWVWHALGVWPDPGDDDANVEYLRLVGAAMEPHSLRFVHPNYVSDQGAARVRSFYTDDTFRRLTEIKGAYDPDNVFHHNQNIPPAG
jgi:FAD/FMN-containing dehydrogenase